MSDKNFLECSKSLVFRTTYYLTEIFGVVGWCDGAG